MNEYLPLNKDEILRYLGYKRKQELTDELSNLINELMLEVQERSNARYFFQDYAMEIDEEKHEIKVVGTDLVLTGKNIFNHLKRAKRVVLLAGTLGIEIERAIRLYEVSELTKAQILDSCCVEYIERVLDLAEVEIDDTYPDLALNRRFSPGYGDLPLMPTQGQFLSAIDATKVLGITLTDTHLMVPRKSVTAIIGLFDDVTVARPNRKAPSDLTNEMVKSLNLNIKTKGK